MTTLKRGDPVHITNLPVGAWFKDHDGIFWRVIRLNGNAPDVERFMDLTDTVVPYKGPLVVTFDEYGDATLCALHNVACCLVCAKQHRQQAVDATIDAIRRFDEKEVMAYIASLPVDRRLTVAFWEPLTRPGTVSVSLGDAFETVNEGGLLASLAAAVRALRKEKS